MPARKSAAPATDGVSAKKSKASAEAEEKLT